ncbi:MAG: GTP cyclohydrolase II, partial [Saprospiraceae bacterium]|nr:GTP cyclohydrolase II [Saprospiraceae bacterium]
MSDARVKTNLPTAFGDFTIYAFEDSREGQPHLALVHKDCDISTTVPIRLHSECLTGDVFKSKRCDCGEQLELSMRYLSTHPGILIYLRQEG